MNNIWVYYLMQDLLMSKQ